MNRFFEKKDSNILIVAAYITSQPKDAFLLGEITRSTPINRRTLINLIDEYNALELEQSGLILNYDIDQLNVTIAEDFTISRLERLLFRETLLFKLCDAIFNKTFTTLADFTNDNFISSSSMYRRQENLRQVLADFSIKLDFANADILLGEEKQIRHFYYELYSQAYELTDDDHFPLLASSVSIADDLRQSFSNLSVPFLKKVQLITLVCFTRLKQGYYLPNKQVDFDSYNIFCSQTELSDFMEQLIDSINQPKINSLTETLFLSFYIQTIDLIALKKFDYVNSHYPNFNNPHILTASRWISELTKFFNISLSTSEYFFLLINLYHHYCRNDYFQGASRHTQGHFIKEIFKLDDPYSYKKTVAFLHHIKNRQLPQSTSFNALYYLLIKEVILNAKVPVNLCVFSSLFQSQKAAIEKRIHRLSPIKVQFQDSITKETDLVIADFSRSPKQIGHKQIPWLMINTFPSNEEYDRISQQLLDIYDDRITTRKTKQSPNQNQNNPK